MTTDRESRLFEFANSKRPPTDEEEQIVTDMHAALGMSRVPIRLMHPPAVKTAPRWNRYVLAVAALMMVFALGRASFMALQSDPGGVPTDVPPVVLGLASQAPATPVEESCDFSGTVPFIAGMDDSPLDEPTLLHRLDRTLVLDCEGEQEQLLQDVMIASPTRTPHVIQATTTDGDYLINIVSKEQLFIPAKTPSSTATINFQSWGPWLVMRSSADETVASVYNLETLSEIPITTHVGVPLTLEEVTETTMHADNHQFVLAYPSVNEEGMSYLNGYFVVVADGSSKQIAVGQEEFPREVAVSPDGQIMATASFQDGTTTVTLFGTEDDIVLEQYMLQTLDAPMELNWQHDGSGLLLHDNFNLYRIDGQHPGDGLEIIAESENLQGMILTPNNDVVAIGSSVITQSNPQGTTLIVDIASREVTEVSGRDLWANPYSTSTRTTLILEGELAAPGEARGPLIVVDAVTGEPVGVIEYQPLTESGFQQSAYGTGHGDITVVAFRPDSMWRLVDDEGNATMERIDSPSIDEGTSVQAVAIRTSDDGHISLQIVDDQMATSYWILKSGSTEWIELEMPPMEVPQGMLPMIDFVMGNGD